jgi:tRNA-Thr(GGU) m(6)t(6)A37 methyltransferase TsaA
MKIEFHSIGFIRNQVRLKKDINWSNDSSEIIVDKQFEQGLAGLMDFSHIIVVFYLNQAEFIPERDMLRRPQGRDNMPMTGILSQRAKDRPNPIGVTTVSLIDVKSNIITVKGLDAIDNTPVIDIKPYYPAYDCKPDAIVPDWVNELMEHYF